MINFNLRALLYLILKIFVNTFYRIFYRFEYRGLKQIPCGKPIVLAPNHVNAFMDPVILAMLMKQDVHFFARGDVFKKPIAKWILHKINMFPMYRLQEGYAEVKKNDKTFEVCRTLLSDNKTILMFPEGICIMERRLKPLKKGLSRIIFQTEESFDFKKDVLVVPVGLNYSDAPKFRSKLFIDCGEPISIKEYEERYKQDKVRAINEFTKVLEQKMSERLIIIKNKDNDALVTALEHIYLNEWMREKKVDINNLECQYEAIRDMAAMVNMMDEEERELVQSLREKTADYIKLLYKNKLRDHLLHPAAISKMSFKSFMLDCFIIYSGMLFYWAGMLVNYLPYYMAKKIAQKKVKNIEFMASMYMNMTMFFWLFYFALQLIIVGLLFHSWLILIVYAGLVVALGFFVLKFQPAMKKIFGRWRLLRMVRKDRPTVEQLSKQRAEIISEIQEMKGVFVSSLMG